MDSIKDLVDVFLHLDKHLNEWAAQLGPWLYVVLFAVIFCETGLVVTPFLPGDSLLFAVGALSQTEGSPIDAALVAPLLIVAGVLGDAVNYHVGRAFGERLFRNPASRLFKRAHLEKARRFYEKHGGKTIILARFVPIVRTFAPFVAGMGEMSYRRFAIYNVAGAVVWVGSLVALGVRFGKMEFVQKNFHYVTLGIIVISVLPIAVEWALARRAAARGGAASDGPA
ncbi:MAG TPA: DedA family protein [Planctomycetota bacterium]|nr:DedA family protein [Planctomycetota bacterium]